MTPDPDDPGTPGLPTGVDPETKAFVMCQSDRLILREGSVGWLPWPKGVPKFFGKPSAKIRSTGDEQARLTVKWGLVSINLDVAVAGGYLKINVPGRSFGLDSGIANWTRSVNATLERNGKRIAALVVGPGTATITKRDATDEERAHPVFTPGTGSPSS